MINSRAIAIFLVAALSAARPTLAGTALGDWGHFLSCWPKVYLNNPDGKPFTFTLHLFRWPVLSWNRKEIPLRLTAPGDQILIEDVFEIPEASRRFEVKGGPKGVYLLELGAKKDGKFQWVNFWLESSLDRSVVWTGDCEGHAIEGRRLVTQCSVPRRWWFWVPEDVTKFTCKAQRADRYMSQREDWGISIFSPRGQRVRMLWGQPPKAGSYRQDMAQVIEVEPGAGGRFWSVEIRLGDSHNYSNINFCLDGVPPYLARSPEEWFDPTTGSAPAVNLYDDSEFMQSVFKKNEKWPDLQHWCPCPSLGDPDGVVIRGEAEFALWNPENRELKFKVGDYLPRTGFHKELPRADVKITGANGKVVFDEKVAVPHHHHGVEPPQKLPPTGRGVSIVNISGVERWLAYTYPATPLVLIGKEVEDGWRRFVFEVGTARNWYFLVPRGTRSFAVRVAAEHETDVVHLEINPPDRTVAMVYGRQGESTIDVPAGLEGKIWHIRADVGSASRMVTESGPRYRYLGIYLTLDLKGVPGYLAPTWEQWFDPNKPTPPLQR